MPDHKVEARQGPGEHLGEVGGGQEVAEEQERQDGYLGVDLGEDLMLDVGRMGRSGDGKSLCYWQRCLKRLRC